MDKETDIQGDGWIRGSMDGRTDRQTKRLIGERKDGWANTQTDE